MYTNLKDDVYSVFASTAWKTTGYKAYPLDYSGKITTTGVFLRIAILPGKATFDTYGITKKFEGNLILSIFVKAGDGDKKLFEVAETLDSLFQGKTLTNGTQFGPSTLTRLGLDSADSSFYRGDYSINFNAYGE
jgi:hypothetical protein